MSTISKTKQLAMDTILFGISTFGSKILVFLLTPLYTAVLLTEEYGIADLINTTVNLTYPVLTLAITDATLRYALDKNCSKRAVLGNSTVIIIISVLMLLAVFPVVNIWNSEITVQLSKYWVYFAATYSMYNIHLCFANFVKGIGKTKLFAVQGVVQTVTVILCNIYFLLFAKMGLRGYLLSIIIGMAIPTVLMFFSGGLLHYLIPLRVEGQLLLEMLRYSIPMIPTLLAWSINLNINKYMLIGFLPAGEGLSATGVFSVANKIPSILTMVLSVFLQAWQISAISNINDSEESAYYTNVYEKLDVIALAGCMLIMPCSKLIARFLFDESYYLAWRYIPFLTLSAYFTCMSGFLASAFRAYKKTGQLFISVSSGAIINVMLNILLINTIGAIGAAVATAVSFLITWLIRMITIQSLVKVKINWIKTVATYIMVIVSCCLISFNYAYSNRFYILFSVIIVMLYMKTIALLICSIRTYIKSKLRWL